MSNSGERDYFETLKGVCAEICTILQRNQGKTSLPKEDLEAIRAALKVTTPVNVNETNFRNLVARDHNDEKSYARFVKNHGKNQPHLVLLLYITHVNKFFQFNLFGIKFYFDKSGEFGYAKETAAFNIHATSPYQNKPRGNKKESESSKDELIKDVKP